MASNPDTLGAPPRRPPTAPASGISKLDVLAVRNLLKGGSVIDWHRLDFRDHDEVDRFLRVNEFDPSNAGDLEHLEDVRATAVEYLRANFSFRIPDRLIDEVPVRDLFLLASRPAKDQTYACVILKCMHIIHHLAGRELLFRLPMSDDEVFAFVERKVVQIVEEIRAAGHAIPQFEWSRKPRDSLITKLLAKRSVSAASVYDKLRFRLVVREKSDIFPLLVELQHRLIPFNYIVPEESVNDILRLEEIVVPTDGDANDPDSSPAPVTRRSNEFSGPDYRVVNFIADIPIRLDEFLCRVNDPNFEEFGAVAFVLTEFQVIDEATGRSNESGENSHERYKERQKARVKLRLARGLADSDEEPPA